MTDQDHIAVIGGGIAGASIAYHLCRESDVEVTVYERNDRLANETTAASGGFFAYDVSDGPMDVRMKEYAAHLYNEFLAETSLPYRYIGRLHVATSSERAQDLRAAARSQERLNENNSREESTNNQWEAPDTGSATATFGTPVQYLPGEQIDRRLILPTLNLGTIAGALLRPAFGYLSPTGLAEEFVERARASGATFVTKATVEEITTVDGRASGVIIDGDVVAADAVVCAAGPWNRRLLEPLGVELPIRHSVAPVLVLEPQSDLDRWTPSIKHEESGYYFRQNTDGTLFVGHNPGGYHEVGENLDPDTIDEIPPGMYDEVQDVLGTIAPRLGEITRLDEDMGVRCLTPDGRPIVGETSVPGLFVAAFNASGVHHAPVAGEIIARQLTSGDEKAYDDTVSISRFEES